MPIRGRTGRRLRRASARLGRAEGQIAAWEERSRREDQERAFAERSARDERAYAERERAAFRALSAAEQGEQRAHARRLELQTSAARISQLTREGSRKAAREAAREQIRSVYQNPTAYGLDPNDPIDQKLMGQAESADKDGMPHVEFWRLFRPRVERRVTGKQSKSDMQLLQEENLRSVIDARKRSGDFAAKAAKAKQEGVWLKSASDRLILLDKAAVEAEKDLASLEAKPESTDAEKAAAKEAYASARGEVYGIIDMLKSRMTPEEFRSYGTPQWIRMWLFTRQGKVFNEEATATADGKQAEGDANAIVEGEEAAELQGLPPVPAAAREPATTAVEPVVAPRKATASDHAKVRAAMIQAKEELPNAGRDAIINRAEEIFRTMP